MQKVTTRYGLYSVAAMAIVFTSTFFIFRNKHNWELQEVIGYVTIVLSQLFVYFGMRRWRDTHNAGRLSFGQGLGLGSLIALFPSLAFGLFSWLQVSVLDPGYTDNYYNYYIEKAKRSEPPAELEATLQKIAEEREMFSSPVAQFGVMFLTVFIIGFIITIISTLLLRRNK